MHVANAHTDSDIIVYFKKANVVHTGDVFLGPAYPFIDTSSGGSLDGVIAAAATVLSRIDDDTRIIPGPRGPAEESRPRRLARNADQRPQPRLGSDPGRQDPGAGGCRGRLEGIRRQVR